MEFLQRGFEEVTASLNLANEKIKEFYDRRHRETPEFQVGDRVWLSHQNIESDRPSRKLAHRRLGPYPIEAKIGSHAYRLTLPHSMKIHPVFHVTLLSATKPDVFERDPPRPPPIITPDKEEEYEVEEILDSRLRRRKLQYLVKWVGYGPEDNSWEPAENVENAAEKVEEFHRRHPRRPRP
jgi:hypothetical protein